MTAICRFFAVEGAVRLPIWRGSHSLLQDTTQHEIPPHTSIEYTYVCTSQIMLVSFKRDFLITPAYLFLHARGSNSTAIILLCRSYQYTCKTATSSATFLVFSDILKSYYAVLPLRVCATVVPCNSAWSSLCSTFICSSDTRLALRNSSSNSCLLQTDKAV